MTNIRFEHFNMKKRQRSKGQTSVSTLAYITGDTMKDESTGRTYSFGRQERVATTATLFPSEQASEKYKTPEQLFNAVEHFEKNCNACTARTIEAGLPVYEDGTPMTLDEYKQITEDFIRKNLTSQGYAATYAIHQPEEGHDERNWHVHILVTNRPMKKDGTFIETKKRNVYDLDENGQRIPIIDEATGLQKVDKTRHKKWKMHQEKYNPIEEKDFLLSMRKSWADICNEHLPETQHITEKSYATLGSNLQPTKHEGPGHKNSEAMKHNEEVREYNNWIREIENAARRAADIVNQKVRELYARFTKSAEPGGTAAEENRTAGTTELDSATATAISELGRETERRDHEAQQAERDRLAEQRRQAELQRERAQRQRERSDQQRKETHHHGMGM